MAKNNIVDQIESGQIARLLPTVADSKKEERATSSLLASFMVVPAFVGEVLSSVGVHFGKRSKIKCYTEVVFKSKGTKRPRPDGLLLLESSGNKTWSAIIESKIGPSEIRVEQIEEYLDLARELGIDAVITISNQFATLATHHPIQVSKQKTRSVGLYHFSWLSLVSIAVLVSDNNKNQVEDTEQAYILNELVRYLQHDSSGVTALTSMGSGWKLLCSELLQGAAINRKSDYVEQSIASWHQLLRFLAIQLSVAIGKTVHISLTRERTKDPVINFDEDVSFLLKNSSLMAEFEIPDAASRLLFNADILRRTISLSMHVDAPKDRTKATAPINWLTRQLSSVVDTELMIRAYWPKRIPMTSATLNNVLGDPKILVPDNVSDLPVSLEVIRIVDLAGRFKGPKNFVEETEKFFLEFYSNVGQRLTRWIPKPPKIKDTMGEILDESSLIVSKSEIKDEPDILSEETPHENVQDPGSNPTT